MRVLEELLKLSILSSTFAFSYFITFARAPRTVGTIPASEQNWWPTYKGASILHNIEYTDVFNVIIYNSLELGLEILDKNIKDKMLDYQSRNLNQYLPCVSELILSNNMHKLLDLNDIIKILTSVSNSLLNVHSSSELILQTLLQEFDFSDFRDHKEYTQIKKLIKGMFPKLNDRTKRKILSNHNYIFESYILKKYIKLVLS